MFVFVVPRFAALIEDAKADVPAISKAVIGFSLWLNANWLAAGVGLVFVVVTLLLAMRQGRLAGGSIMETMPILSRFQASRDIASWARTLGGALKHGAELLPAMDLAERVVRSVRTKRGLAAARMAVRAGRTLAEAVRIRRSPIRPTMRGRAVVASSRATIFSSTPSAVMAVTACRAAAERAGQPVLEPFAIEQPGWFRSGHLECREDALREASAPFTVELAAQHDAVVRRQHPEHLEVLSEIAGLGTSPVGRQRHEAVFELRRLVGPGTRDAACRERKLAPDARLQRIGPGIEIGL
jgi:hypothetical protein